MSKEEPKYLLVFCKTCLHILGNGQSKQLNYKTRHDEILQLLRNLGKVLVYTSYETCWNNTYKILKYLSHTNALKYKLEVWHVDSRPNEQKLKNEFATFEYAKTNENEMMLTHNTYFEEHNTTHPVMIFRTRGHQFLLSVSQVRNQTNALICNWICNGRIDKQNFISSAVPPNPKQGLQGPFFLTRHKISWDSRHITHHKGDMAHKIPLVEMPIFAFEEIILCGLGFAEGSKVGQMANWTQFLCVGLYDPRILLLIGRFAFPFELKKIELDVDLASGGEGW